MPRYNLIFQVDTLLAIYAIKRSRYRYSLGRLVFCFAGKGLSLQLPRYGHGLTLNPFGRIKIPKDDVKICERCVPYFLQSGHV